MCNPDAKERSVIMAATATAIMVVLFMARSIGWEGVTDVEHRQVASFYGGKYGCHGCLPVKVDEKMSSASRIRNCVVSCHGQLWHRVTDFHIRKRSVESN